MHSPTEPPTEDGSSGALIRVGKAFQVTIGGPVQPNATEPDRAICVWQPPADDQLTDVDLDYYCSIAEDYHCEREITAEQVLCPQSSLCAAAVD